MSKTNHGAPKPLNFKTPTFADKATSTQGWESRIEQHNRFGTPPTRRATSGLSPAAPKELNPALTLGKALLAPPKITPQGANPQKPRKRSPDGKFSENQSAGTQSAGQQDADEQERAAKRTAVRMVNMGKAMVPEESMPPLDPSKQGQQQMMNGQGPQQQEQPIGRAPSGMPIYGDPYHPEHEQLTPEDHHAAAEMHNRKAVDAQGRGDHVASAMSNQRASIHRNLAADQQLPMERILQQMAGQQPQAMPQYMQQGQMGKALPGAGEEETPTDKFLSTQHQEDQGKPNFGDRYSPGPQPGKFDTRTRSPIGPLTAQTGNAGTFPQPEMTPPPPAAMNGSMPELNNGQGTTVGQPPGMQAQTPQMQPAMPMGMPPMAMPATSLLDQLLQKPQPQMQQMLPPAPGMNQSMPQPPMPPQQMTAPLITQQPQMGGPAAPRPLQAPPAPQMTPPAPGQDMSAGKLNESGEEPQEQDEPTPSHFGGSGTEEKSNQETLKNATKSLSQWLSRRK